ncbi:MAG TPA: nuclear transport factor 2 family protein [Gemmatimonadaceae bacterium]|nr:nuclear transport factor 2 family protein [Gemmatimonadaceae bacterium]
MTEGPIEKQLLDCEKQYWSAIRDKNVQQAMRLTDDPCFIVGASGVARISQETFGKMMQAGGWTLHEFTLSDVQIRLICDDAAIIAYKVKELLTVDGKSLTVEAADSSTWVRRDGQWVCSMHTEALLGDPFGRDKVPMPRKA